MFETLRFAEVVPLLNHTAYRAPLFLRGGHVSTIAPVLLRAAPALPYHRTMVDTPDSDFLDLDRVQPTHPDGADRVVVILHGLEGSSQASYVRSMAAACVAAGWHVLALNFRGCSGRVNRLARSYHSGVTEDLQVAVEWAQTSFRRATIALVGFSLGGNVLLKYLGEGRNLGRVKGGVAISVPVDLASSATVLARPANRIYMQRFMRDMVRKLELKNATLGTDFDLPSFRRMRSFAEFDGAYTAPVHGFESAADYWKQNSSLPLLANIPVPTLLIQAQNDPFLSPSCYPVEAAQQNECFFLETPKHGGHVGFMPSAWNWSRGWMEGRTVQFLRESVFGASQ
jgi:uncharacterized protein